MDEKQIVLDALNRLGETPEAIAAKLAELGIRSEVGISDLCPLAVYATRECGFDVAITEKLATYNNGEELIDLPDQHEQFVSHFDMERYPQLIATAT